MHPSAAQLQPINASIRAGGQSLKTYKMKLGRHNLTKSGT